jgi:uncharacterized membrane protein YqjE
MSSDAQEPGPASHGGLFGSLKRVAATLLAMGSARLELLSTELEEQRVWLGSMLMWTLIGLFCAALGVVLATLLVVVVFWDTNRVLVLSLLVGLFFLAAIFAWSVVRNMARTKPRLFSASLAELSKDREQLTAPHE